MDTVRYFFQNYIWSPILSTVIAYFLGLLTPYVFKKLIKFCKAKIARHTTELSIAGEWNSFFHEERVLQVEEVHFTQTGQQVKGVISMAKRNYSFEGVFKNQILLGTYESASRKKDERGTIVLRYVNENLLSGYCTFIYKNRQIYNSPYVLTLLSEHRADKGTYQFCNSCVGRVDCCCNCKEVDMPILLPFEVEAIESKTKNQKDAFAKPLTAHLQQMKRKDDDETKECFFFINGKCSIYEYRPIDCRMFPFDFKEIAGEYWVIYYDTICKAIPTDKDEISICAHNMRPLLQIMLPYMSECSDPVFSKRLEQQHYRKLFAIDKIINDYM